jgi:nucleoid DNA-binding protein
VNKIIPHIEKLIAWNDHVVVPGLGAFVVQRQPAFIRNDFFYAPTANISFNSLINNDDGTLAIEVSRHLKITYRRAVILIEREVKELFSTLQSGNIVSIGRLGSLQYINQKVEFLPLPGPAFLPDNAFFSEIKLTNSAKKAKIVTLSSSRWMQYAAVIILLFSLFIPGTINHNSKHQTADFSVLSSFQLDEIVITPEDKPTGFTDTQKVKTTNYQIVVAVYQSENKALELCTQLHNDRYPEAKIVGSPGSYKVVVATYYDLVQAVNHMEQIRKTDTRFTDAWVMKI